MAAHLEGDDLPTEFDVIVEGTGLIQSLLAAALGRVSKRVLHLDKNSYYGDTWANLMYRDVATWVEGAMEPIRIEEARDLELKEGEKVVDLKLLEVSSGTSNVVCSVCEYPGECNVDRPKDEGRKEQEPSGEDKERPKDEGHKEQQPSGEDQERPKDEGHKEQEPSGEDEEGGNEDILKDVKKEKEQEGAGLNASGKLDRPGTTWKTLERHVRQLCVDFAPKVLFSAGPLVDLLVQSDVSRYLEFQPIKRLLTLTDGVMEQVPCSRADLFSSKSVSMVEKRRMMKFLTFCAEFEKHPEEYQEMDNLSFQEFLENRDLTPSLIRFIVHSIASVSPGVSVLQGLKATQTFLQSLGRYGNTPFLFPLYGPGDITQAFCRFAAVYGGIYCLRRSIQSLVVDEENKCRGLVCTSGQHMKCSNVVTTSQLVRRALDTSHFTNTVKISRAVLLTDRPLYQGDSKGISVISIPPGSLRADQVQLLSGIELDPSSCCCPFGTFLIHLTCVANADSAKEDLQCFVDTLLRTPEGGPDNDASPWLLWSLYYNQEWIEIDQLHCHDSGSPLPVNVHLTSDPTAQGFGYEKAVEEAKLIFQRLCPEEDFLPPPEPQEEVQERIIDPVPSDVKSTDTDATE